LQLAVVAATTQTRSQQNNAALSLFLNYSVDSE